MKYRVQLCVISQDCGNRDGMMKERGDSDAAETQIIKLCKGSCILYKPLSVWQWLHGYYAF